MDTMKLVRFLNINRRVIVLGLAYVLLLQGCMVGPKYVRPSVQGSAGVQGDLGPDRTGRYDLDHSEAAGCCVAW